jgi:PAS domain-containing protein
MNKINSNLLCITKNYDYNEETILKLSQYGFNIDFVSCEQELINKIIDKEKRVDLIIRFQYIDQKKPNISDDVFANINLPILDITSSIDQELLITDIAYQIDNKINAYTREKAQVSVVLDVSDDDLLEAFALHEIICDNNGNPIDYRFLDADKKFLKRLGKTKEELIGKTVLELFPQTEKIWIETFGRVALSGNPEVFMHYSIEFDNYYEARIYSPEKGQFLALFIDSKKRKGKYIC